jgi:fatty acid-binding protein DegV
MLADKIQECIAAGQDFETVKANVLDYQNHCHTLFCLKSMMNLARNGRVHPAVAKIAGMLSIRVAGEAANGQITDRAKPRGDKKATETLLQMMKDRGFYDGALLRIAHCNGEDAAMALVNAAKAEFPNMRVKLENTTGLCSFYAEEGGLMIGLEGGFNEANNNLN